LLTDAEKDAISKAYRHLAANTKDFCSRPQQRQLIGYVANARTSGSIGVAEAPTAIGKSLGYLVPSVVLGALRKERTVISTGTVILQKQILERDLPLVIDAVEAVTGVRVSSAILKGRSRFVCNVRLQDRGMSTDLFESDGAASGTAVALLKHFRSGEWRGDIDTAPVPVSPEVWATLRNERQSCLGKRCSYERQCPQVLALEEASRADLLVTNHDMLMSILVRSESEAALPAIDKMHLVLDEVHQLPDKILSATAEKFDFNCEWIDQATTLAIRVDRGVGGIIERDGRALKRSMKSLAREIERVVETGARRLRIGTVMPKHIAEALEKLKVTINRLQDNFKFCFDTAKLDRERSFTPAMRMKASSFLGRMGELSDIAAEFCEPEKKFHTRWFENTGRGWSGCTSPFLSGPLLKDTLWDNVASAVCVSATLAHKENFTPMLIRLGLTQCERHTTIVLDSPLDYSRSQVVVPKLPCGPENVAEHTRFIAEFTQQVPLDQGGVLTLFSSKKQMQETYDLLPETFKRMVLMQGGQSNADILKRHAGRVRNAFPSILFGMLSFGEGLDLPGRLCATVVIAKIPFPSFDDPLLGAASEYLKSRGREPFTLLFVPAAAMALRQFVGRLVRRENDHGTVYILDNRLRTKSYARTILSGLPMRCEVR
jgi:ATP-dependent DNA helicase DinG